MDAQGVHDRLAAQFGERVSALHTDALQPWTVVAPEAIAASISSAPWLGQRSASPICPGRAIVLIAVAMLRLKTPPPDLQKHSVPEQRAGERRRRQSPSEPSGATRWTGSVKGALFPFTSAGAPSCAGPRS